MPGKWAGVTSRRLSLPKNWDALRTQVFARDGHRCVWVDHGQRCTAHATECDHIGDRLDHSLPNLRSLCATHHRRVTSQQGNSAHPSARSRRPPEPHPGYTQ